MSPKYVAWFPASAAKKWLLLALSCALVAACGGSGSSQSAAGNIASSGNPASPGTPSSSPPPPPTAFPLADCLARASTQGIEGTGRRTIQGVIGAITDSSVTVDDIDFDASHATVYLNGVCAKLADLRVGVTATVDGEVDDTTHSGTAFSIYADENVIGEIDSIDPAAGTLSIAGQPIIVTPATTFGDDIQPAEFAALTQNDMVAVSGLMRADRTLVAARIHRWPPEAFHAVAGTVTSVDAGRQRLYVSGVEVAFDNAVLVNFPGNVIQTGDYVRALGQPLSVLDGFGATGIVASAIQRVVVPVPDPKKDIVLAGAVSFVRTAADFDVMGQPVRTNYATRFAGNGMDLVSWGPAGVFITVFGSLDPSGYVIADLVVTQWGAPLLLMGPITSIDPATRTVGVIGVPMRFSSAYSYLERGGGTGQAIPFDALRVGDQLTVEGSPLGNNLVDVLIARQGAPSSSVAVNGWGWSAGASHRPIIVMTHGIQVDSTSADFFWGHPLGAGCSCRKSSADEFWNWGDFRFVEVQVYGTWTGDHVNATKVYWIEE